MTAQRAMTGHESARETLITAARKLFADRGFHAVSIRDITEAAGTNVSAISYHFGGKEGLYRACLEAFGKNRLERATTLLKSPATAEEFSLRLRFYIDDFFEMAVREKDTVRILYRELETDYALTRDLFQTTYLEGFRRVIVFFAEAQAQGFVRQAFDPMAAAGLLKSMLIHNVRMDGIAKTYFGISLEDPVHRAKAAEAIHQMVCAGVMNPSTATHGGMHA